MKEWMTAREIAEAVKRLKLSGLPVSVQGWSDHAEREEWAASANLCRKRQGRGGGREFHVSLLPDRLVAALQGEKSRDVVLAHQQERKALEASRRQALTTASLSARQREVMEARAALLSAIEAFAVAEGWSRNMAIEYFIVEPAIFRVPAATVAVANDRANSERDVSARTIKRWFAARDEHGVAALAPLATKEKQDMPGWFWQFLRFYAQPQKPCLNGALSEYAATLPPHQMPPNYDQVRRLMNRLGNVEKHRGREGSLTLKARMAYVMRSTADLLPTCVYTADGKTFDAEVSHPIHGGPFRPEISTVVDVATRRALGFSVGLAENSFGVVDALRHAIERAGIPAIFYVDRGPGFRNDLLDNQLTGITERLGVTKLHSLPYNSQARGIIERFNGSVWNRLAKEFDTYVGPDMDRQAKQIVFKQTRRDIKLFGASSRLPSFASFIDACNRAIAAYNAAPHSSLPGRMSPDEAWAEHVRNGFEAVMLTEGESADLFRPYVKRRTRRALVEFQTNSYFHLALEEFDGDDVLVGYDIHDASKVWVRQIETGRDGIERLGRLICIARFAGNEQRYIPLTMERAAMEKRAAARARRLEDKLAEVEAELSPGRYLEDVGLAPMPLVEITPEPANVNEPAPAALPDAPRRRVFESDAELAAWAIENPSELSANQLRVLRTCLSRPAALELFRLSGIDVERLRTVIRAAA